MFTWKAGQDYIKQAASGKHIRRSQAQFGQQNREASKVQIGPRDVFASSGTMVVSSTIPYWLNNTSC